MGPAALHAADGADRRAVSPGPWRLTLGQNILYPSRSLARPPDFLISESRQPDKEDFP